MIFIMNRTILVQSVLSKITNANHEFSEQKRCLLTFLNVKFNSVVN